LLWGKGEKLYHALSRIMRGTLRTSEAASVPRTVIVLPVVCLRERTFKDRSSLIKRETG